MLVYSEMELEQRVMCFYQAFRPQINIERKGYGDCTNCKYDPESNSRCKGYKPIRWYIFGKDDGTNKKVEKDGI